MNCILFSSPPPFRLPVNSAKADHIKNVLKMQDGAEIFAGQTNGKLYICNLRLGGNDIVLTPSRETPTPATLPVTLCVGFARRQIAQKILFDTACFGIERLIFYAPSKGEAAYANSALYQNEASEWLIKGAEQACATHIPHLDTAKNLEKAIAKAECGRPDTIKAAPDLYEAADSLKNIVSAARPNDGITIILGSERGFDNSDRRLLRSHNYTLASMGKNVLRTDSAVTAALAITQAFLIES